MDERADEAQLAILGCMGWATAGLVVCGLIFVGVATNLVSDWLGTKTNVTSWTPRVVVLLVVALAIVVLLLNLPTTSNGNDARINEAGGASSGADGTTSASLRSPASSPAESAPPPPDTSISVPPDETGPPVMATSLLDLPAVQQDTNSTIDLDFSGTTEINGRSYGRVLTYKCSLYCDGTSPQVLEVTLGRKFSTFTATYAVLDVASGKYRLDITTDASAPQTFYAEPGLPAAINIDVNGVSRMRVQMYASGELLSPIEAGVEIAGGNSGGGLPGVGLADPTLLPAGG